MIYIWNSDIWLAISIWYRCTMSVATFLSPFAFSLCSIFTMERYGVPSYSGSSSLSLCSPWTFQRSNIRNNEGEASFKKGGRRLSNAKTHHRMMYNTATSWGIHKRKFFWSSKQSNVACFFGVSEEMWASFFARVLIDACLSLLQISLKRSHPLKTQHPLHITNFTVPNKPHVPPLA